MNHSIIILRTHTSPDSLGLLGKTGYWQLNLERVQGCREVQIYNWEGTQRLVAPTIPQECYSVDMFGRAKTVIAFNQKAVRFEQVNPPRRFSQCSAFYQSEVGDEISEPDDDDASPAPLEAIHDHPH